ncbi:MAG: hypothetical protein GEU94_18920 [Micromonosporaceae bacterium]|nr:hypothetical protein [Micromonosporaceae bacterium]
MAYTSIRVATEVRDRLSVIAEQRGTSLGQLLAELAAATPTPGELTERGRACQEFLEREYGHVVTDDDIAAADEWLHRHLGVPG